MPTTAHPSLDRLFVFIMAGGSGERFWPMSRNRQPKHLLRLLGERTLLEETIIRALGLVPAERVFVLTNESQLPLCRETAHQLPEDHFIAEPAKRDTAPACALATAIARKIRPDAICALLPSDAMIYDAEAFRKNLVDATLAAAEHDAIITIGIKPTYAATGFGYLKLGKSLGIGKERSKLHAVEQFVEKPNEKVAEQYLNSGNYAWNAGLFIWKTTTFLAECQLQLPSLATFITDFPGQDDPHFLSNHFALLPKISVDYAIMEKAKQVIAIEANFDWDDVGCWTALSSHFGKDEHDNTTRGPTALLDAHNNIVIANTRLVALCGVSDLIVVETDDAILVCHQKDAQNIKQLQSLLPKHVC